MDRKKKHPKREENPMPQEGVDTTEESVEESVQEPEELTREELLKELEDSRAKRDEYLAMAQRVQADFDNFRKRNRNVVSESFDDGARAFIKTILPVVDNLDRALLVEKDKEDPLYQGVSLVLKQFNDALSARGVTPISRKGEVFDPKLEDAVAQGDSSEGEPGTVCEVVLKGYQMGEHVIRHAMVRVVPDL
ncbi:MAG: nucleotide exchange factor GrpE [Christensenellales bacterium]|jgi:molecular chaperone GrpE